MLCKCSVHVFQVLDGGGRVPKNLLVVTISIFDKISRHCSHTFIISKVGKSSTINAMCRAKKVSVSATPGKTKYVYMV